MAEDWKCERSDRNLSFSTFGAFLLGLAAYAALLLSF